MSKELSEVIKYMEGRFLSMDKRFDLIDKRLSSIEKRLYTVEMEVRSMHLKIDQLNDWTQLNLKDNPFKYIPSKK